MVSWPEFQKLSGSPQHNFEVLCRALVRLHYGKYGQLAALANQPGVEFHLHLHTKCTLGDKGTWFGWQCRFYDLPDNKALRHARQKQILEAITKTEKFLPRATDWVLWTRHTLTKSDQNWFYALKTRMRLHLWDSNEVDTYLTGDAEILRRTYFGDLILTPEILAEQHKLAVAWIGKRWLPQVHQPIEVERKLRRILAEATSWEELISVSQKLSIAGVAIKKEIRRFSRALLKKVISFIAEVVAVTRILKEVYALIEKGDFDLLRQLLATKPFAFAREIEAVPRLLRSGRFVSGLYATNALADLKLAVQLLGQINDCLGKRLIAVLADAGGGKTQLAAQLTMPIPDRPAGILLFGRDLHSGRGLDDLAKIICIQGVPVPSMEALLAALDAAGQRACRRIPLVIDGLNEAEDPREWKPQLAALNAKLVHFANVLVVCTIRTGARLPMDRQWGQLHEHVEEPPARMDFAKQALPDDIQQFIVPDFGQDTMSAIKKYFNHFRINAGDVELPFELISHPLTLRIFCEITNPDRQKDINIEGIPGSLTNLFEKYIDHGIERIGQLAPRHHRYCEQDIRRAINLIGNELWNKCSRELSEQQFRKEINDDIRSWNESIVHMLEQEGIILRIPSGTPGQQNIIPVYDAFGGHIVATSIIANVGSSQLES